MRRWVPIAVLLAVLWPQQALAHAFLVAASPVPGSLLHSAPGRVRLTFSEAIVGGLSSIVVLDRRHQDMTTATAVVDPRDPRLMSVPLRRLSTGSYLVVWTSVSADDGHLERGSFSFSVRRRGPLPAVAGLNSSGQTFPDRAGLAAIVAHWVELLAAVVLAGMAAFSALVFNPSAWMVGADVRARERRRLRTVAWVSFAVLAVSSTLTLGLQGYELTGSVPALLQRTTLVDLISDQYGTLWVGRLVILLVAAFLLLVLVPRSPRPGHPESELAGILTLIGALYLFALAASGHAASAAIGTLPGSHSDLFSISILADWLHLLADALWFGGQVYVAFILVPIVGTRLPHFLTILRRYSPLAFLSVVVVSLSGAFNGVVHIPSVPAFLSTIYGRTLIVKIGLIGLMVAISAYTVFLLRPRIGRLLQGTDRGRAEYQARRLRAWLRVNPVLGSAVLLATSVMFYYPVPIVPHTVPSAQAQAGKLTAHVSLSPDRQGVNRIEVSLRAAGVPVEGARVDVLATMLQMPMPVQEIHLRPRGHGRYVGSMELGMLGNWSLQVLVARKSGVSHLAVQVTVGI